jgi:hypothetical protein
MRNSIALLFLSGALLLASCDLFGSENGEPLVFQNVEDAEPLKVQNAQTAVFKSEAAWTVFWEEHVMQINADGEPIAPPEVNFAENMLIAVFWGNNGYAGCSFFAEAIKGVSAQSDALIVEIGKLPDLGPCRMSVMPLHVIKVERTEATVVFKGRVPH